MRSRSISILATTLVLGLVLLIGYIAPGRNSAIKNQPGIQQQGLYYQGNLMEAKLPGVTPQNPITVDRQKSDNIRRQLNKMSELSRAEVIVTGNTALVGYRPSKKVQSADPLRTIVINKVRQVEPSIKNVVVSESADIASRINKLTRDITNNRPGAEVSSELKQLLQRVTPAIK